MPQALSSTSCGGQNTVNLGHGLLDVMTHPQEEYKYAWRLAKVHRTLVILGEHPSPQQ